MVNEPEMLLLTTCVLCSGILLSVCVFEIALGFCPEHQWVGRQKPKAISNTHTERRIPEQSTQVVSSSISGSSTIGNESPFQAHSVLESSSDFRLILRLENARGA